MFFETQCIICYHDDFSTVHGQNSAKTTCWLDKRHTIRTERNATGLCKAISTEE